MIPVCSKRYEHSPLGGTPQPPEPAPYCEHHGPVCQASTCRQYRCHPAQPPPEAYSGYPDLAWPGGSYDTSSTPSDTRYPDHIGADVQRNPWFGWPQERWPKTSPSEAFGSCGRWYGRSVRSGDDSACTDIFGAMRSGRLDHGYSEGTESHRATCV